MFSFFFTSGAWAGLGKASLVAQGSGVWVCGVGVGVAGRGVQSKKKNLVVQ